MYYRQYECNISHHRLFETDQINFNSSTLTGSNDGTNMSLIWLINAPIHSFIQVQILEPWVGCGSSLEFYERGEIKFIYSNCEDVLTNDDGQYGINTISYDSYCMDHYMPYHIVYIVWTPHKHQMNAAKMNLIF